MQVSGSLARSWAARGDDAVRGRRTDGGGQKAVSAEALNFSGATRGGRGSGRGRGGGRVGRVRALGLQDEHGLPPRGRLCV